MNPIVDQLIADGWRAFPSPFRNERKQGYAKCFEDHAECKGNQGKRKQVEVYHHFAERISEHLLPERFSVECVGKLPDNEWLRMQVEGLSDLPTILRTVDQLLRTWDHAVSISPTIEEPD